MKEKRIAGRRAADFACLTRLEESGLSAHTRGQSANGFVACKQDDYLKVDREMGQLDRNMEILESHTEYL